MKLKTIRTKAFGCLKDWASPGLDQNLVLVYGRNEAGKSTLFNLVTTLFYGWSPASKNSNPYFPWDGTPADLEALLATDDGREIRVYRRLRSRPEGTLVEGNTTLNLGNGALTQLISLPREIFTEVYAITADQLRFPEPGAWHMVQNQLLGGQYASFLRPLGEVTSELENEARHLWHTDQRSGARSRELQQRLRALNQQRREAEANEAELRRIEGRLGELNQEQEQLLAEKTRVTAYLNRSQRLGPVRRKIRRIQELRLLSGDIAACGHLPDQPEQVLNDLAKELNSLVEEQRRLLGKKQDLEAQLAAFTQEDKRVLAQQEKIKALTKSYSQLEADRQALRDLAIELERCRDRLRDRARDFLQGGWQPELAAVLKSIDEAELRAGIASFKRADARYQQDAAAVAGLRVRAAGSKLPGSTPFAAAALFLLGVAGMLTAGSSPWGFFAALLAFLGCGLGFTWWLLKGGGEADLREAQQRLASSGELRQEARRAVAAALKGLPVASRRLEMPEESLLLDVNKIKDLVAELEDCLQNRELVAGRLKERASKVGELLQDCGLAAHPDDLLENIRRLEERLSEAEERSRKAAAARNKLAELEQELGTLEIRINGLEARRSSLLADLERLSGSDLREKINNLKERRGYLQQAQALEEDLRREYPDLEELKREIKDAEAGGESWIFDDEETARAGIRREAIESRLNDLQKATGTLRNELEHRLERQRLDDIEGAIAELEAERQAVAVKRDRLVLLKNLLVEAGRRYREEHQPDVLQKAGRYLAGITGGRYDRLFLSEAGSQELMVRSNYQAYPLAVGPPLSRGTLQQIYLSLRLALVDHLDAGGERLPLFLDEVLVNWDSIRLEHGLILLKEMATRRQVFLFTCHRWLIDHLLRITPARLMELG